MRELKYQAYHKGRRLMYDVHDLTWEVMPDGSTQLRADPGYAHMDIQDAEETVVGHHVELRQYTGKKDQHGQEIYEGDKLLPGRHLADYGPQVVKWSDEACAFCPGDEIMWDEVPWEIAGNIHEQPETT